MHSALRRAPCRLEVQEPDREPGDLPEKKSKGAAWTDLLAMHDRAEEVPWPSSVLPPDLLGLHDLPVPDNTEDVRQAVL